MYVIDLNVYLPSLGGPSNIPSLASISVVPTTQNTLDMYEKCTRHALDMYRLIWSTYYGLHIDVGLFRCVSLRVCEMRKFG